MFALRAWRLESRQNRQTGRLPYVSVIMPKGTEDWGRGLAARLNQNFTVSLPISNVDGLMNSCRSPLINREGRVEKYVGRCGNQRDRTLSFLRFVRVTYGSRIKASKRCRNQMLCGCPGWRGREASKPCLASNCGRGVGCPNQGDFACWQTVSPAQGRRWPRLPYLANDL